MKNLRGIYTLLFGVAVLLFFGLAYPHHLHYQEQYQLFLFDSTYVWDIVRLPGGVADLLGRFCTQFFLYAWVGALIIALLLSAIQFLVLRLFSPLGGVWDGASFIPSFLLWLFLLDENALLGGVWAVLLTLIASCLFALVPERPNDQSPKQPTPWLRLILLFAAIPILYWIVGPVCVVFFLLQIPRHKYSIWYYGAIVVLAIMIVILSSHLPVSPRSLWTGIHYYRYPTVIPVLLWSAALSVLVLALITCICHKQTISKSQNLKTFLLCALCFLCGLCAVWKYSNFKAEKVMQYDFMACHQQWNRIIETINKEKPNNQIGVTVQNLALAMRGMLLSHMSEYNQNGIAGLLPDVEAQEAILDFQKSGRCYKRLAQTNLINGNYEVARKYLTALQKTLFYSDWANETLQLLGDEEAIAKHPEYGRLRKSVYKDNAFFSDHVTPDMLESLYFSNKDNSLAYQYLVAYYILTNDRERYNKLLLNTSTKQ